MLVGDQADVDVFQSHHVWGGHQNLTVDVF